MTVLAVALVTAEPGLQEAVKECVAREERLPFETYVSEGKVRSNPASRQDGVRRGNEVGPFRCSPGCLGNAGTSSAGNQETL